MWSPEGARPARCAKPVPEGGYESRAADRQVDSASVSVIRLSWEAAG